ncbi:MAG: acetate--CoA ligase family protein, partial [Alphaproteobacteria bacterium]|nr:acetate--CoA ligase family protein [Alphaproteobacteria bacterium]
NRHGVPAFAAPESCAAALAALLPAPRSPVPAVPPATSSRGAASDLPPGPGPLNEAESKRLFARFGIPSVAEFCAPTPEAAADAARGLAGPVVVKILSRAVAHKSEIGGVAVGVAADQVAERCRAMRAAAATANAPLEGFLVQEQIRDGIEMILGFHRDPQLGPAILLGLGGIATELFEDTAIRLPPFGPADVEAMIAELKSAALLNGFRGHPKADVAALADAVLAFQAMVAALGDGLAEAEINPLFVRPQGQGVRAADGVVVLR